MSSNIYYRFGNQGPRYASQWSAGAGGVWPGTRAAETKELGSLSGASIGDASSLSGTVFDGTSLSDDTLGALMTEAQAPLTKRYPALFAAVRDNARPVATRWKLPAVSGWPSMRAAGPEPLDPSGLGAEQPTSSNLPILNMLGAAAAAYHGYKRTKSTGWTIGWTLLGGLAPLPVAAVALAQGFGKPKRRKNPSRRRPRPRYGKAVGRAAVARKRSRAAKKGWRRRRR